MIMTLEPRHVSRLTPSGASRSLYLAVAHSSISLAQDPSAPSAEVAYTAGAAAASKGALEVNDIAGAMSAISDSTEDITKITG